MAGDKPHRVDGLVPPRGLSILLYAPFWTLGGLSRKRRRPVERAARLWPLIAVLSLLAALGIFIRLRATRLRVWGT